MSKVNILIHYQVLNRNSLSLSEKVPNSIFFASDLTHSKSTVTLKSLSKRRWACRWAVIKSVYGPPESTVDSLPSKNASVYNYKADVIVEILQ